MEFNEAELEAYLDESLDPARAAELEHAVRQDPLLLKRLSQINGRRDAGMHTLGEIWRRHQIGVPAPNEMRDYLAGQLSVDESNYIEFRIKELKCPFTIAMQQDLKSQQVESDELSRSRRDKFYEKSAGLLRKKKK